MFDLRPYRKEQMNLWNPFSDMENMEKHFFDTDFFASHALSEFKTDITDEGDHYELKADLPGFKKEDIHLDLDGDTLSIRAERHSDREDKDKQGKFIRCERSYGSYIRSFDISGVAADDIKAYYDGGVLMLKLPKQTAKPDSTRHLEIN